MRRRLDERETERTDEKPVSDDAIRAGSQSGLGSLAGQEVDGVAISGDLRPGGDITGGEPAGPGARGRINSGPAVRDFPPPPESSLEGAPNPLDGSVGSPVRQDRRSSLRPRCSDEPESCGNDGAADHPRRRCLDASASTPGAVAWPERRGESPSHRAEQGGQPWDWRAQATRRARRIPWRECRRGPLRAARRRRHRDQECSRRRC